MQFLTDNLLAAILVGGLLLLLATITLRQQEEAGAITNRQAVSGKTASLTAGVRVDFENIAAFQAHTDSTVTFTVTDDPATMAQSIVTYRRSMRVVEGDTLYDVQRSGAGGSTVVGPGLADWSVELRDSSGAPTTVLADAERAVVRFVLRPAFTISDDTLDVVWEHTFAPPLLGGVQF